jgi:type II secretion system protein L
MTTHYLFWNSQKRIARLFVPSIGFLSKLAEGTLEDVLTVLAGPCVVFIDGQCCISLSAPMTAKQYSQLDKNLAWLIEDSVTEDIDQLHIIAGNYANDALPLLVIKKRLIEEVINSFNTHQKTLLAIIPDYFLLPYEQTYFFAQIFDDSFVVRLNHFAGFASSIEHATIFSAALTQNQTLPDTINVSASNEVITIIKESLPSVNIDAKPYPLDLLSLVNIKNWSDTKENLLQGEFVIKSKSKMPSQVRLAIIMIVIAFCITILSNIIQASYFYIKQKSINNEVISTYQKIFPKALFEDNLSSKEKLDKVSKRLKSYEREQQQNISYLPNLLVIAESAKQVSIKVKKLEISDQIFILEVEAVNLADVDKFKALLANKQLNATVISANNQVGAVTAKIKIEGE